MPKSKKKTATTQVDASVRPCEQSCTKCGSTDMHRRFRAKGVWGNDNDDIPEMLDRRTTQSYPNYQIKQDYIKHVCRCCGFVWGSNVLPVPTSAGVP